MRTGADPDAALAYLRRYQEIYASVTGMRHEHPEQEITDKFEDLLKDKDFMTKVYAKEGLNEEEFKRKYLLPFIKEGDYVGYLASQLILHNKLKDHASASVPAGVLPTNDFNAAAIRTDTGLRVVVLNTGIVAYMSQVINSFLATFTTPLSQPLWSPQDAHLNIVQWSVAIATGNASLGIGKAPSFKDPQLMQASGNLGDTARIFILGHEYGHFILGHLDDAHVKVKQLIPGLHSLPVAYFVKQPEQEYAADEKGVELCLEWCKATHGGQYQVVFLAVVLTYHLLRLIEIFTPAKPPDELTHPGASLRRKRFEDRYASMFDAQIKYEIGALDKFMDGVYGNVEAVKGLLQEGDGKGE